MNESTLPTRSMKPPQQLIIAPEAHSLAASRCELGKEHPGCQFCQNQADDNSGKRDADQSRRRVPLPPVPMCCRSAHVASTPFRFITPFLFDV